jgi:hypothetical protein
MLNIQVQQLKNDLDFKGSQFMISVKTCFTHNPKPSQYYFLIFTCIDTETEYVLTTQINKTRRFKSLDTALSVVRDIASFNDLYIPTFVLEL